ncbi:MAG: phosphate ABC transporter permease subunit PstC [Solirubrobacterales bacterium]
MAARPRYGERVIQGLLAACAVISVATTAAIVISLLTPTIGFFDQVTLESFFSLEEWAPTNSSDPGFGVLRLVIGTLSITFWSLLFAVPLGLLSAIYLSEYAGPRIRKLIKPVLEVLAGVPTVALGVFALTFISPEVQGVVPGFVKTPPFFVLAASLGIALLLLPIIASISDDAMKAVPGGLREGAYALGATKLKVSTRVVFPAAISGIVASVVLAASRAVGETMVVLLVAGATPNPTFNPGESVLAMTAAIGRVATGDIATGTITYDTIFAVGAVLFVMTLGMNAIAIRLVRRFREVYE